MFRLLAAEAVTSFLKMLLVCLYGAWAAKTVVIDSDINPLFAISLAVLSTYGLWIIVKRISDYVVGQAEQRHVGRTHDDLPES